MTIHHELFEQAAEPTLAAIEYDESQAPPWLRPLFASIRELLFDPDATLETIQRHAGVRGGEPWKAFGDAVGQSAWEYVQEARLEIAARLLVLIAASVAEIGWLVGNESDTTFRGEIRAYLGVRAQRYQLRARRLLERAGAPPVGFDRQEHWEEALEGRLGDRQAWDLFQRIEALHPSGMMTFTYEESPATGIREELAEALAGCLDELSWSDQRRFVHDAVEVPDETFFEVLSRRGRAEESAERGAQLALLAIDSLASNGLLESQPGLAALAWTRAAVARRRAGDLPGAEEALAQATRDFERTPSFELEPAAEAERRRGAAALEWFLGRREEAGKLAKSAVRWHRATRSPELSDALLLRAELFAAAGEAEKAIGDLDEALGLFEPAAVRQRERCLDLWVRALVQQRDKGRIVGWLPDVRELAEELGGGGPTARLRWLEGHGSKNPEPLWRDACDAFAELGDDAWVARVTFDLLAHRFADGSSSEKADLAAGLAAALGTLARDPESLAAVGALRQTAVHPPQSPRGDAAGQVTADVLEKAGDVLRRLEWDLRAQQAGRFA